MYVNNGAGQQGIEFWGLSPSDNNTQINNFKIQYGVGHPCAGTEGGGPAAIDIAITGQPFFGYPTWIVVCPDRSFYFDVCWPPTVTCFDPYFEACAPAMVAGFIADQTEVCEGGQVLFTDQSTGDPTSWEWTFEGGDPPTSTEQNPLVTYAAAGLFDVSLTVASSTANNTITSPDFINVNMLPDVTLMPFDTVCDYWSPFELSGGMPEGGVYDGTGVEDGFFYPDVAGLGTHEISYFYVDENDCENWAYETIVVDVCAGIDDLKKIVRNIYPNPTTGEVFIEMGTTGNYRVQVTNILGALVHESHRSGSAMLNLSDLDAGLYTLTISDGHSVNNTKLTISK